LLLRQLKIARYIQIACTKGKVVALAPFRRNAGIVNMHMVQPSTPGEDNRLVAAADAVVILRREKKCTFHAGCWLLTHENTERFLEDVFVCEYMPDVKSQSKGRAFEQ
jgi:hypothetical protein